MVQIKHTSHFVHTNRNYVSKCTWLSGRYFNVQGEYSLLRMDERAAQTTLQKKDFSLSFQVTNY